ncbi:hypothetical protein [Ohtaekwangia sp.]|uniref:hypothetical protein n=1 Tax=Ohtaekwangia sp. TaxID=2066019 RepID=UPI002F9328B1
MENFQIGDEVYVSFGSCVFKMTVVQVGTAIITLKKDNTEIKTPKENVIPLDAAKRQVTLKDFVE